MTHFPLMTLAALHDLAQTLPGADMDAAHAARDRQGQLTKPPGSLGRLEEIVEHMAAWHGLAQPRIDHAQALVFAGNHGICAHGISPFPPEVTVQMVANFQAGGAAINQLCHAAGATLAVHALDLETPTRDYTQTRAMSDTACLAALNTGAAAVDAKADILILGEMGIGNSTVAAGLAAAVFGGDVADWVGPGTGADAAGQARKANVISDGLALHRDSLDDGAQVLAALGGREQAAICGATLAARLHGIPVLLDGFICTAAVAPLHKIAPSLLDHCLVAHMSAEPGHAALVRGLGKAPLLDLGMRLGEGSGAAVALSLVRAALACHNGMATFAEAGVATG